MTGPSQSTPSKTADIVIPAELGEGPGGKKKDEISLVELATEVVKGRWTIARSMFWVGLLGGVIVWAPAPSYTVTAMFTPQTAGSSSSTLSGLAGVAAQFGVTVPSSGGASPDLYVALLGTPQFLLPIVNARYKFRDTEGHNQDATYIDLNAITEDSHGKTLDAAVVMLLSQLSITDNTTTGTVTIGVQTQWPQLSVQIAQGILAQVDTFNMSTRQQQAKAIAGFTDTRLAQAQAELHAAEDSLGRFQEENRTVTSPRLIIEQNRLMRAVTTKQSVYMTLVQTYEQARIDAVRNTPSIVVVQPVITPLTADKRHLKVKILAAMLAGAFIGTGIVIGQYLLRQGAGSDPVATATFNEHMGQFKQEAKAPVRWIKKTWQRFRGRTA